MKLNGYLTELTTRSQLLRAGLIVSLVFFCMAQRYWLGIIRLALCMHFPMCLQFYCAHLQLGFALSPYFCVLFPSPVSFIVIFISLIFSTGHSVQCDGCLGRGWVWQMQLVVGLRVQQVLGCFTYLGLGLVTAPRYLGT